MSDNSDYVMCYECGCPAISCKCEFGVKTFQPHHFEQCWFHKIPFDNNGNCYKCQRKEYIIQSKLGEHHGKPIEREYGS